MAEKPTRVFSLAEANELVPEVADLTALVIHRLEEIREGRAAREGQAGDPAPEVIMKQVEEALADWSARILELGALPKGYFTVDFQSIDPELLYCWTYGEEEISFTHKVWENFTHRRPLGEHDSGRPTRWIH